MKQRRWHVRAAAALVALTVACGGGDKQPRASAPSVPAPTATPAATGTPAPFDWHRLERYLPTDRSLPELLIHQATLDLSNEAAAGTDQAQLADYQRSGRVSGAHGIYLYDAGVRNVSVGVSYYSNTTEPKRLLRETGDPTQHTGPNRFLVDGLGDEYIAQRLRLGGIDSNAFVINIVFVRGPFYVSLADLGGTPATTTDVAEKVARLIDERFKAAPKP